jgi:serine/threonine protein kinase
MNASNRCPQCGTELTPGAAPEGLCPRCLLAAGGSAGFDERADVELLESLVGRTVDDKYRVDRVLGRGGMGAVYLATHVGTERPVAVKVLAPHLMDDDEFVQRFRREARAAGRLRHPNIVNVTDFGFAEVDDRVLAYLVMEHLDGVPLAEFVARKYERPRAWIADVVEQIALAVDEAHRHGVIHRDLKPGNIWLVPDGRGGHHVKVLDFGLAKLREVSEASDSADDGVSSADHAPTRILPERPRPAGRFGLWHSAARSTRPGSDITIPGSPPSEAAGLTRAGALLGTPLYMSPEQCRGERLDGRSDVYSLGLIVYELLTGFLPFSGNADALVAQHVERTPTAPSLLIGGLPKTVDDVLLPALAKVPDERPATAGAFAAALKAALQTSIEKPQQMLSLALTLYGERPSLFLALSPVTGVVPFVLFSALAAVAYSRDAFGAGTVTATALMLIGWFVAGGLNSALVVPVVARLLEHPHDPVRPGNLMRSVGRIPTYFLASLWPLGVGEAFSMAVALWLLWELLRDRSYSSRILWIGIAWVALELAQRYNSLRSGVALLERRGVRESRRRASDLAKRLESAFNFKELGGERLLSLLLIGSFAVALSAVATAAGVDSFGPRNDLIPVWILITIGTGLVLNPVLGICSALRYVKARQLGGESLDDLVRTAASADADPYGWMNSPLGVSRVVARQRPAVVLVGGLIVLAVLLGGIAVASFAVVPAVGMCMVAFALFLARLLYQRGTLVVTDEFVSTPSLFRGWKTLRWDDVFRAPAAGETIVLEGYEPGKIVVHPGAFENGAELRSYVVHQLRRRGKYVL